MSLINDALKRAGQTSGPPPVPGSDHGKGLEPISEVPAQSSPVPVIIFPVLLFLILGFAAYFLVRGIDRKSTAKVPAREKTAAQTESENRHATGTPSEDVPALKPADTVAATTTPVVATTTNTAPATPAGVTAGAGNASGVRVQAIFYRAKNPAAVVNSKMVFVGDSVGTAKVVAIEKDTVILEQDGQRKTLTLF